MAFSVTISYAISSVESFNDGTTNITYTLSHDDVELERTRTDTFFTDQLTDNCSPADSNEDLVDQLLENFERLASKQMKSYANAVRRRIEQTLAASISPTSATDVTGLSLITNRQRSLSFSE